MLVEMHNQAVQDEERRSMEAKGNQYEGHFRNDDWSQEEELEKMAKESPPKPKKWNEL